MKHIYLTRKVDREDRKIICKYKLSGPRLELSNKSIDYEFPAAQLTDAFNKIVELNIPFSAPHQELTEWIKLGYPKELIAIPEKARYSKNLAEAVLSNIYRAAEKFPGGTHIWLDRNIIEISHIYEDNPDLISLGTADSYRLYTGKHLADLQFADKSFTTDEEVEQYISIVLSMDYPISAADIAVNNWFEEYSEFIRMEEPTAFREKLLALESQGFYLVSTTKLKFYAPRKTKEELLIAIRALAETESDDYAGETSFFS